MCSRSHYRHFADNACQSLNIEAMMLIVLPIIRLLVLCISYHNRSAKRRLRHVHSEAEIRYHSASSVDSSRRYEA